MKLYKKSMILILCLAIFVIFIILPSLLSKLLSISGVFSAKVGETQYILLNTHSKIEEKLFYIDQVAKYSAFIALNELENKGGYATEPACGTEFGYTLWQNGKELCFPDNDTVIFNFQKEVNSPLNSYLKNNNLPTDNYEYFIRIAGDNFRFIGTALRNLNSKIYLRDNKIGEYSIRPSFDTIIDYDISFYEKLKNIFLGSNGLLNNISICEAQKPLKTCIEKIFFDFNKDNNVTLELDCEKIDKKDDRIFLVCAENKNAKYSYFDSESKIAPKIQEIKFAIYIKESPLMPLNIEVINPNGEDKYAIIKWNLGGQNINHYNLYYSEEDFSGEKIENQSITGISSLEVKNSMDAHFFDENCYYQEIGGKCLHKIYPSGFPLLEESLANLNNKLICSLDTCYYITDRDLGSFIYVTAVDEKGDGTDKVEKAIEFEFKDNLAPNKLEGLDYDSVANKILIQQPKKNIDNTDLTGPLTYYYFLKEGDCEDIIKLEEHELSLENRRDEESIITILSSTLSKGKTYCMAVFAADSNGNPVQMSSENGINHLKVKPEYVKIFQKLYTTKQIQIP